MRESLGSARLFNRRSTGELYVIFPGKIYVYQYERGVFYYYTTPEIGAVCEDGNDFYFSKGIQICKAGGDLDGSAAIQAEWRSKPWDFGEEEKKKHLFRVFLTLMDSDAENVNLSFLTEKETGQGTLIPVDENSLLERVFVSRRIRPRRFLLFQLILRSSGKKIHLTSLQAQGLVTDDER